MRAVHADMLTLFDAMSELEGRHATEAELRRVHEDDYLESVRGWVRRAEEAGHPIEVRPGLMASGASWDASLAAVGCVLTGVEAVLEGSARNAFCAIRPPGRDVEKARAGRFGFLNPIAIAARHLLEDARVGRVLIVEWGGGGEESAGAEAFADGLRIRVLRSGSDPVADPGALFPRKASAGEAPDREAPAGDREEPAAFGPDFVLLSAGFDELAGDPVNDGSLEPLDYYAPTVAVREFAESACSGRLVSVLEGGYGDRVGQAVVQHLRGLVGIDPLLETT